MVIPKQVRPERLAAHIMYTIAGVDIIIVKVCRKECVGGAACMPSDIPLASCGTVNNTNGPIVNLRLS